MDDSGERDERGERAEMFAYYDARADTYDEFYQGRGAAIPELSGSYRRDTAACLDFVAGACRGDVLDLACGTGYWLRAYGSRCTAVTLVDQSPAALARCSRRLDELGLRHLATIVQGDVFEVPLPPAAFDSAVIGFFLSHLTDAQIERLFTRVREVVRPDGVVAIVDSGWSDVRAPFCRRDGFERRPTPGGRAFRIRKRYFTRDELGEILPVHGFRVESAYEGDVFVAVAARRWLP